MRAAFTVERSAPACPARIFLAALRAGENKLRESRPIAFLCAAVISFSIMSPSTRRRRRCAQHFPGSSSAAAAVPTGRVSRSFPS